MRKLLTSLAAAALLAAGAGLTACDGDVEPPVQEPTIPDTAPDVDPQVNAADGADALGNGGDPYPPRATNDPARNEKSVIGETDLPGNAAESADPNAENRLNPPDAETDAADLAGMEQAVASFTNNLAAGEVEAAREFVLPQDAFETIFAIENDPEAYTRLNGRIRASIDRVATAVDGGEFDNIEYLKNRSVVEYPAGTPFPSLSDMTITSDQNLVQDIRVKAMVDGEEYHYRIDHLIRHDGQWYLVAPLNLTLDE